MHETDRYARSTGKTGVCLVTSGPGATNIVTGIANTRSGELFEQIKKQLNRCVGIIKVWGFTDHAILARELLFVRIDMADHCLKTVINEMIGQPAVFYPCTGSQDMIMEILTSPDQVDWIIAQLEAFPSLEVIRGGAAAIQIES